VEVIPRMAERRTWNPFRREQDAFQLLIAVIACFAATVIASLLGGAWAGVAVFVAVAAAGVVWLVRRNRPV
jgi:Flp pilus assembly protein TadB